MAESNITQWEAKRQARVERYENRAAKAREEARSRHDTATEILAPIPPGQPILVGHHSEKRHRRDLERISTNMRKASEAHKKAEYWDRRAEAAACSDAISSDDENAIDKMRAKIAELEESHEVMKKANAILRAKPKNEATPEKLEQLQALGLDDKAIQAALDTRFDGAVGFPGFALSNSSANIRRCKQRLARLEAAALDTTSEEEANGIRLFDNVEDNRVQLFFPGKPELETRKQLKRSGFRWAPSIGAWQRHRNPYALQLARGFLEVDG